VVLETWCVLCQGGMLYFVCILGGEVCCCDGFVLHVSRWGTMPFRVIDSTLLNLVSPASQKLLVGL